jgi:transposase
MRKPSNTPKSQQKGDTHAKRLPHRHDISDQLWEKLKPHLKGRKGTGGGNAKDNRRFINAVFWILRARAFWRDLPPDYGHGKNVRRRFCRWRDGRDWKRLWELLVDVFDIQWLMIDASHVKVHQHATGAVGGNEGMRLTKGGLTPRYT